MAGRITEMGRGSSENRANSETGMAKTSGGEEQTNGQKQMKTVLERLRKRHWADVSRLPDYSLYPLLLLSVLELTAGEVGALLQQKRSLKSGVSGNSGEEVIRHLLWERLMEVPEPESSAPKETQEGRAEIVAREFPFEKSVQNRWFVGRNMIKDGTTCSSSFRAIWEAGKNFLEKEGLSHAFWEIRWQLAGSREEKRQVMLDGLADVFRDGYCHTLERQKDVLKKMVQEYCRECPEEVGELRRQWGAILLNHINVPENVSPDGIGMERNPVKTPGGGTVATVAGAWWGLALIGGEMYEPWMAIWLERCLTGRVPNVTPYGMEKILDVMAAWRPADPERRRQILELWENNAQNQSEDGVSRMNRSWTYWPALNDDEENLLKKAVHHMADERMRWQVRQWRPRMENTRQKVWQQWGQQLIKEHDGTDRTETRGRHVFWEFLIQMDPHHPGLVSLLEKCLPGENNPFVLEVINEWLATVGLPDVAPERLCRLQEVTLSRMGIGNESQPSTMQSGLIREQLEWMAFRLLVIPPRRDDQMNWKNREAGLHELFRHGSQMAWEGTQWLMKEKADLYAQWRSSIQAWWEKKLESPLWHQRQDAVKMLSIMARHDPDFNVSDGAWNRLLEMVQDEKEKVILGYEMMLAVTMGRKRGQIGLWQWWGSLARQEKMQQEMDTNPDRDEVLQLCRLIRENFILNRLEQMVEAEGMKAMSPDVTTWTWIIRQMIHSFPMREDLSGSGLWTEILNVLGHDVQMEKCPAGLGCLPDEPRTIHWSQPSRHCPGWVDGFPETAPHADARKNAPSGIVPESGFQVG